MPVEVMRAELRARGVMISGDRGTVARVLCSMRDGGPPPALVLRQASELSESEVRAELGRYGYGDPPADAEPGDLRSLLSAVRQIQSPAGGGTISPAPALALEPLPNRGLIRDLPEFDCTNPGEPLPPPKRHKSRHQAPTITEGQVAAADRQAWVAVVDRFEDAASRMASARTRASAAAHARDFAKANRLSAQASAATTEFATVERELCERADTGDRRLQATGLMLAADQGSTQLPPAPEVSRKGGTGSIAFGGPPGFLPAAPQSLRSQAVLRDWRNQGFISDDGLVHAAIGTTIVNPVIASRKLHKRVVEGRFDVSFREILKDDGNDYHEFLELNGKTLTTKDRQSGLVILDESSWSDAFSLFTGSLLTQWPNLGPRLEGHRRRVVDLFRRYRACRAGLVACRYDYWVREAATTVFITSAGESGTDGQMIDWAAIPELIARATHGIRQSLCRLCGSADHVTSQCRGHAPATFDPPPADATGGGGGSRKDSSEQYCFEFNKPKGCKRPNCPYPHRCSKCLKTALPKHRCSCNPKRQAKTGGLE